MISNIFKKEYDHFKSFPKNMRILLMTNLMYALVLPILELFVGAYILRQISDTSLVVIYQLAVYMGILFTFMINGFLLRRIKIAHLYSLGMLLSGVAMTIMMMLNVVDVYGIAISGFVMGYSFNIGEKDREILITRLADKYQKGLTKKMIPEKETVKLDISERALFISIFNKQ
jgi:YQGE family putative transporter